jgi:hypothetical protein
MIMSVERFFKDNGGTLVLMLMLTLSLGLNIHLVRRGTLDPRSERAPALKIGAQIPSPLLLVDSDSKPVSIDFTDDSRPTVLYVLSPLCSWCKRNEPNMKALVSTTRGRFRYLGLSIESNELKQYITAGRAPFPVYLIDSNDVKRELEVNSTPETIVVSPTGKVQQIWEGAYFDTNQEQVEKFFGVKLPGLQEPTATAP